MYSAQTLTAYHFVGNKLRNGRDVPLDGEWLRHEGEIKMCHTGLHASRHPLDALSYAPGPILCRVVCRGIELEDRDKFVCRERMIIARVDATAILWKMARMFALDVIHLWDAPDIVKYYLIAGNKKHKNKAWRLALGALEKVENNVAGTAAAATVHATKESSSHDAARAAKNCAIEALQLSQKRKGVWDDGVLWNTEGDPFWDVVVRGQRDRFEYWFDIELEKLTSFRYVRTY